MREKIAKGEMERRANLGGTKSLLLGGKKNKIKGEIFWKEKGGYVGSWTESRSKCCGEKKRRSGKQRKAQK